MSTFIYMFIHTSKLNFRFGLVSLPANARLLSLFKLIKLRRQFPNRITPIHNLLIRLYVRDFTSDSSMTLHQSDTCTKQSAWYTLMCSWARDKIEFRPANHTELLTLNSPILKTSSKFTYDSYLKLAFYFTFPPTSSRKPSQKECNQFHTS